MGSPVDNVAHMTESGDDAESALATVCNATEGRLGSQSSEEVAPVDDSDEKITSTAVDDKEESEEKTEITTPVNSDFLVENDEDTAVEAPTSGRSTRRIRQLGFDTSALRQAGLYGSRVSNMRAFMVHVD